MVEQIMVERGIESLNKEFKQKFDSLISRVFREEIELRERWITTDGLHVATAHMEGWNIYQQYKQSILKGVFEWKRRNLVGRLKDKVISPDENPEEAGYVSNNAHKLYRHIPVEIHVYDQAFLEKAVEFAEQYKLLFGQEQRVIRQF